MSLSSQNIQENNYKEIYIIKIYVNFVMEYLVDSFMGKNHVIDSYNVEKKIIYSPIYCPKIFN